MEELKSADERLEAIDLANRLLDEPNCDPDDDLRVLSRQLLRHSEALAEWHRWTAGHVWVRSEEYAELCELKRLHGPTPLRKTP